MSRVSDPESTTLLHTRERRPQLRVRAVAYPGVSGRWVFIEQRVNKAAVSGWETLGSVELAHGVVDARGVIDEADCGAVDRWEFLDYGATGYKQTTESCLTYELDRDEAALELVLHRDDVVENRWRIEEGVPLG